MSDLYETSLSWIVEEWRASWRNSEKRCSDVLGALLPAAARAPLTSAHADARVERKRIVKEGTGAFFVELRRRRVRAAGPQLMSCEGDCVRRELVDVVELPALKIS